MASVDLRSLMADGEVLARVGDDPDGVTIAGMELDYAEITSSPAGVTAAGEGNRVDVTGLSISPVVGTRPIVVEAYFSYASNNTADRGVGMAIVEGTTVKQIATHGAALTGAVSQLSAKVRLAPSAGSHTYKVMVWVLISGTGTFHASATHPAWIQAVEV